MDDLQELSDGIRLKYTEFEEKHALEILQLVRQKKAYQQKVGQVGFAETERRVKMSLHEQKYRAGYLPNISEALYQAGCHPYASEV